MRRVQTYEVFKGNRGGDVKHHPARSGQLISTNLGDAVDGRNPAPVDMENNPLFTGFYRSQVVQNFFHQPYNPQTHNPLVRAKDTGFDLMWSEMFFAREKSAIMAVQPTPPLTYPSQK